MKTLPIDRTRTFRESDYPREPAKYTILCHFSQQRREDNRFLSSEVINACITEGDLRDNQDGCACFRKEWGQGVAYYLIAGYHLKGYPIIVTGWPHVHDYRAALKSGRWSADELDAIQELNRETEDRFEDKYPQYDAWLKSQYEAEA